MSIAEELAGKHLKEHYRISSIGGLPAQGFDATVAAINEALELAAQEAENLYDKTYWDDSSAGIAATIRRLKSPAGPVRPSRAQEP